MLQYLHTLMCGRAHSSFAHTSVTGCYSTVTISISPLFIQPSARNRCGYLAQLQPSFVILFHATHRLLQSRQTLMQ